MINLVIVAEVRLYREGLVSALERVGPCGIDVVATVPSLAHLMPAQLQTLPAPVVLFDVARLSDATPVRMLLAASPGVRVVALGVTEDGRDVVSWAEAGVAGYVSRVDSIPDLLATIESVARDELACPPRIAAALNRRVAALADERRRAQPPVPLSRRELEVVDLIEQGKSNREIGRLLFIQLATVKNHVHNILDKLEMTGRTDVATWARGQQLDLPGAVFR
jgi:two-component system nitrate/nitrite response regulator NarL